MVAFPLCARPAAFSSALPQLSLPVHPQQRPEIKTQHICSPGDLLRKTSSPQGVSATQHSPRWSRHRQLPADEGEPLQRYPEKKLFAPQRPHNSISTGNTKHPFEPGNAPPVHHHSPPLGRRSGVAPVLTEPLFRRATACDTLKPDQQHHSHGDRG